LQIENPGNRGLAWNSTRKNDVKQGRGAKVNQTNAKKEFGNEL